MVLKNDKLTNIHLDKKYYYINMLAIILKITSQFSSSSVV